MLYAATSTGEALWVTSWPFAEYVKHEWAGDWVCSAFRNEGAGVASELIVQAVAASRFFWPKAEVGLVTFINRAQVRPTIVRSTKIWGWTYRQAGFREVGETKGGLLAMRLPPEEMPASRPPRLPLFAE